MVFAILLLKYVVVQVPSKYEDRDDIIVVFYKTTIIKFLYLIRIYN
jgi:hypothetical protein